MSTVEGAGVMRDGRADVNESERFKGNFGSHGGTSVSADGLRWTPHAKISFPRAAHGHQAYDCHNNLVWDWKTESFLMTTHWYHDSPNVRCIMHFRSVPNEFGGWPKALSESHLILNGSSALQLYSQITFPYYNLYLGLVMVFDTKDPTTIGTVECRLAWSSGMNQPWSIVGWSPDNSSQSTSSAQFIPRGAGDGPTGAFDSQIIFAAAHPVPVASEGIRITTWAAMGLIMGRATRV